MRVLTKINHHSVDKITQDAWHTAFECRKKDPLGLNDIDEWTPSFDSFETESEPNKTPDWLEAFLQE